MFSILDLRRRPTSNDDEARKAPEKLMNKIYSHAKIKCHFQDL
jgi:hypothetical protein